MKAKDVLKGVVTCVSVDGKVGHSLPRKITAAQLDVLQIEAIIEGSGDEFYVQYTGSKVKVLGWVNLNPVFEDVARREKEKARRVKQQAQKAADPLNRIHINADLHINPFAGLKLAA